MLTLLGKLGRDEGPRQGPEAGDGADVGATPDVEGTAPDQLPPRPGERDQGRKKPVDEAAAR